MNVREHVPQGDDRVLEQLVTLAVHVLSPAHTGASLIWWLIPPELDVYAKKIDLQPLRLRVEAGYFSAVQHLLNQHDGATIISPTGEILATGVQLQSSDKARLLIPETRGTRHTSARRYSFDEARVVVVTVSQDGPVSVFSDGVQLGEVRPYSAHDDEQSLIDAIPEKRGQTYADQDEVVCSNCGKTMRIETLVVAGWKEREEAYCQVCREQVASRMCFKIETFIMKRI